MKKALLNVLFICLFVVSGLALAKKPANQSKSAHKMPPTVVQTITAHSKVWQNTINFNGSLSAFQGIMISSVTSERVTKIYFKSGQYVKQGEPLIQLYPNIIKAQFKKAEAQLKLSQADYQRALKLYKRKFLDAADLDKLQAKMQSDQADFKQAKSQLGQTLIKSPFAGKLGLRLVSLGEYLTPGTPIVNLQALDPICVDFSVSEIYLSQIKIGNKITLRSRAFPCEVYQGTIYALDSSVDPKTRMLGVRAKISNVNHTLLPGSFVSVTVYIEKAVPQIIIPQPAIVYSPQGNYVYRMINHKAVKTPVKLGQKLTDSQVIIIKGLKSGDVVIVGGQMKLFDESSVMTQQEAQKYFNAQKKQKVH